VRTRVGLVGVGVTTGSRVAWLTISTGAAAAGAAVWMEEQIWQCPDSCSAAVWLCASRSVAANRTMQAQSRTSERSRTRRPGPPVAAALEAAPVFWRNCIITRTIDSIAAGDDVSAPALFLSLMRRFYQGFAPRLQCECLYIGSLPLLRQATSFEGHSPVFCVNGVSRA
jgi:hypothetical protein